MAMSQALSEEEFHRMQVREFAVAFLEGPACSCVPIALSSTNVTEQLSRQTPLTETSQVPDANANARWSGRARRR